MALFRVVVVDDRAGSVVARERRCRDAAYPRAVDDDGLSDKIHTILAKMRVSAPAASVRTR